MLIRLTNPFVPLLAALGLALPSVSAETFVNFETIPVHPIELSPDRSTLGVCNVPDGRLELFDVTSSTPVSRESVPVGIDPVSSLQNPRNVGLPHTRGDRPIG